MDNPFSEQDLDQLEELLAADIFKDEAMTLDVLQGFLCAVVSGPEEIPAAAWLPEALGEAPAYESPARKEEAEALVLKFYRGIAAALEAREDFDLILYGFEDDPEELDYGSWCDGYVYGSQMGERNWFEAAGEYSEDLTDKMEVFFLLNGLLKEDTLKHGDKWMSPKEEQEALAEAQEELPNAVGAIYRFWQSYRAKPAPARREESKVGRNDPCPCGSGKKYKQCCGKDAA